MAVHGLGWPGPGVGIGQMGRVIGTTGRRVVVTTGVVVVCGGGGLVVGAAVGGGVVAGDGVTEALDATRLAGVWRLLLEVFFAFKSGSPADCKQRN